jgi:hypothetical protein
MTTRSPRRPAALLGAVALVLGAIAGACGDDDDVPTATDGPEQPSDDGGTVDSPGMGDEDFPAEAARDRARATIGVAEDELEPDVRIGRHGDEQFMLTEDYVLGRIIVELDDDGSGTFVVTQARVELPDGPETFTTSDG